MILIWKLHGNQVFKVKAEEKLLNSNKQKKKAEKVNLLKSEIEENDDDFTDDHCESLELLTVDDAIDTKRDYNLRDKIKSYKKSTRKTLSDPVKTKNTFQLNVNDQRFQAIYTQAAFNIDQSDPQFKSTADTQQLIEEKFKKRNLSSRTKRKNDDNNNDILTKLKRKSIKKRLIKELFSVHE